MITHYIVHMRICCIGISSNPTTLSSPSSTAVLDISSTSSASPTGVIAKEGGTPTPLSSSAHESFDNAIVICGFNNLGSNIATFLSDPSLKQALAPPQQSNSGNSGEQQAQLDYVAFDLDPNVVIKGYRKGQVSGLILIYISTSHTIN